MGATTPSASRLFPKRVHKRFSSICHMELSFGQIESKTKQGALDANVSRFRRFRGVERRPRRLRTAVFLIPTSHLVVRRGED
jgi:hypothetical protein